MVGTCAYIYVANDSQIAVKQAGVWHESYWSWVLKLIKIYTPDSPGIVFDYEALQDGPVIVGSPAEAVDPIEVVREFIGLDRMIFMFDLGGIPDENL